MQAIVLAIVTVLGLGNAAARQLGVITEEPYVNPSLPPTAEQIALARNVQEFVASKAVQLQVADYVILDGRSAVQSKNINFCRIAKFWSK